MQNPLHHTQLAFYRGQCSFSFFLKCCAAVVALSLCSACSWMAMDDERMGVDVQKVQLGQKATLIVPSKQLFYPKTANFKPKAFDMLESIAAALRDRHVSAFTVLGYVDNMGSKALNDQLSNKQAEVLMAYLWKHVPGTVWAGFEGKGSQDPMTSSKKAIASGQNRRLIIAYQDKSNGLKGSN